jgi:hypothetical protein
MNYLLCLRHTQAPSFAGISAALQAKNVTYRVLNLPGGARVYSVDAQGYAQLDEVAKPQRGLALGNEKFVFLPLPPDHVRHVFGGFVDDSLWVENG